MRYEMRGWARNVIYGLAIVNVALIGAGTYFELEGLVRFRDWGRPGNPPYYLAVFCTENALNAAFLGALLIGSLLLWRRPRAGRWTCTAVFAGEIVYVVGSVVFEFIAHFRGGQAALIEWAMGATGGTGNMGIALQMISGYPIIALVLLNLAFAKGAKPEAHSGRSAPL